MDRDLVTQVCRQVFPSGGEITWNPDDVAPEYRYWVISGNRGPRWIIPNNPKYGWPFLTQWTPYNVGSRTGWKLLMAAYRTGLLALLPHAKAIGFTVGTGEAWDHIGWTSPYSPKPVIYVGSPGTARKAVAGLINPDGQCTGVAKFPLAAEAGSAITREASILNRLATEKPGLAPRILIHDEESGISVQEAFEGEPTGRKLTEAHVTWLLNMIVRGETVSLREAAGLLGRESEAIQDLDQETRTTLDGILSKIDDPSLLPVAWVHGDFAPWNLKQGPDGTLRAIDWEESSPRGLPLYDLIYFRSIQTFLFRETELFPRSTQRWLKYHLGDLAIGHEMFRKIVLASLTHNWLRRRDTDDLQYVDFLLRQMIKLLRSSE